MQAKPVHIGNLTIANDTPAALIAGLVQQRASAYTYHVNV